jgi:hypothetical protein
MFEGSGSGGMTAGSGLGPRDDESEVLRMGTAERSYTHMDKTGWGHGPWNDEPDKLQWIDVETDLDCLIVRTRLGALCGYVGVPSEHPWHGRCYSEGTPTDDDDGYYGDDSPCSLIDVHGSLTYAAGCQEDASEEKGICHVPEPGRPKDVWWFGFDCAHSFDLAPGMLARMGGESAMPSSYGESYKTVGYVREECARLAEQLLAVGIVIGPRGEET